jgi:hypothetical protein
VSYARVLALGAGDRSGFSRNGPYANRHLADAVLGFVCQHPNSESHTVYFHATTVLERDVETSLDRLWRWSRATGLTL